MVQLDGKDMSIRYIFALMIVMALLTATSDLAAAAPTDVTDAAFDRCLAAPANASTAGQTDCEITAARTYDQRMNTAYNALLRRLAQPAAATLRRSQRAWLAYRDAEAQTRQTIFATRQGTMYVPMQSDAGVTLIGDRAKMLERYVRVLAIE
jgi:uncharacterized protein YecT (DUF1311 family)